MDNHAYMAADEKIEDLGFAGLKILQKVNGFRFGTDSVLLADFASKNARGKLLDLCSGTAIVPLLLSQEKNVLHISALEIQENVAEMAKRSVLMNGLEDKISVTAGDLKRADEYYTKQSFDAVTCNPPYMKVGGAIKNELDEKTISRHEVMCTLEDVVKTSVDMLKANGRLYMVHKPTRLAEIIAVMCRYKAEPKRMRLVYASKGKEPSIVLIEAMKSAKPEIRIEPPFYIFNEQGEYSEEMKKIYRVL